MNPKSKHKTVRKSLVRMTAAQLANATKGAEKIDFDDTGVLPPAMAADWERAKRGRGRPRIGLGAEKVLISMEKRLLLVTDALARRKGLDRSKLVALAIREMLEREAAEELGDPAAVSSVAPPNSGAALPHAGGRKKTVAQKVVGRFGEHPRARITKGVPTR